ncbi:MAG TPA: integrase family protein [Thermoanaerobaculia bacterium]|nr:integrase family protein [Thermoanaerobaculia bacterium]
MVRNLKATGVRYDLWDNLLPRGSGAFGVRVSADGTRSWVMMYYSPVSGKKVRTTLGRYPQITLEEARRTALGFSARIAHGEDPALVPDEKGSVTFSELSARYLERYAVGKRSLYQDQELLDELVPRWGDLPAASIGRRQIGEFLDLVQDRAAQRSCGRLSGARMADRFGALLSKLYNFGFDRGLVESNPAFRLGRRAKSTARERWLTEPEVGRFVQAMLAEGSPMAVAWLVMLFSLARQQETLRMRRQDLWIERDDLKEGWWQLPAAHAKNGRARLIYLAPVVREILYPLLDLGSPWVFASAKVTGQPLSSVGSATSRFRRAAQIPDLGTHTLRKTGATILGSLGTPDEVTDACLGVAPRTVGKKHYQLWGYEPEKRAAFEALAKHVEHLTTPTLRIEAEPAGASAATE